MGKLKLMAALLILISLGASADEGSDFHGAAPTLEKYGVIFQIDADSKAVMKKTLNNIRNVLNDPRLKGKVQVELLANSAGYRIYDASGEFESQLKNLAAQGVLLAQCQNTLKELKVDPKTLYPFIHLVPSAMGELVIREGQGWAYIHPSY